MTISSSRIAIARGTDPRIAMAVRSFDAACSPSYTVASKRWSVWRLLSVHVEPAVLEAFERRQPGQYAFWLGTDGLSRWMRLDQSGALADRRLKSMYRVVDGPLKPSVETLRNLLGFVLGLQPKRAIPEEVKPLRGAPQRARHRRASSEPYCELCWRLSLRAEAIERGDPTYQEGVDADVDAPTRWLSDRYCGHHDPKKPTSDYRRDLRYRKGLETAMGHLRRAVNSDNAFHAEIARDDPSMEWPPDIQGLHLAKRPRTAFSPLVMRMRWHAYQIARHRPSDTTISAVRLAQQGHSQVEIARRLTITPQAVSKALRHVRGVFDFSKSAELVWLPEASEAPRVPHFVQLA